MSSSSASRYLWAADPQAAWIPTDKLVENRYHVLAPQLWLDTKTNERPEALWPLPDRALPYAHLSRYRLHLPQLYGFCSLGRSGKKSVEIPLLDNIPIDARGELMPTLSAVWPTATALQQAYWLWQLVNLWQPLVDIGVGYSLLDRKNVRVQDWRIRLCELLPDSNNPNGRSTVIGLASMWQSLLETARPAITAVLAPLISKMQMGKIAVSDLALAMNQCLLEQAALLPLTVQIAGGTDPGSNQHNEDSFYPSSLDLPHSLCQYLGVVCDGVAGHEGGELASQMAVQSLRLQIQSFLDDVAQETTPLSPVQITDHLKSVIRVVNNLIASQNDEQSRDSRRRMATTLVMALQLPQQIHTAQGSGNSHEIYIAHVGDSRAYWLTKNSCQLLTVDDDVAQREVSQGKSMPWQAQGRINAGSLTQALGIRAGEELTPMVQRLMIVEDGVLLLCSDGLSDRQLIERSWQKYIPSIIDGELSLDTAVHDWIHQAAAENGHDNISLVLMSFQVTPTALAEPESPELEPEEPRGHWVLNLFKRLILLELLLGGLAIGLIVTYILHPQWFQQFYPTPPTSLPSPSVLPTLPTPENRNGV